VLVVFFMLFPYVFVSITKYGKRLGGSPLKKKHSRIGDRKYIKTNYKINSSTSSDKIVQAS